MPNSRRRRFSVHNGIAGRDHCKVQTGLQTRYCTYTRFMRKFLKPISEDAFYYVQALINWVPTKAAII